MDSRGQTAPTSPDRCIDIRASRESYDGMEQKQLGAYFMKRRNIQKQKSPYQTPVHLPPEREIPIGFMKTPT